MDKYWYCGISVKGIKQLYFYISDIGELPLDSYVLVPFGSYNDMVIGMVKLCAEYTAEEAPYPVEKTKRIVREATAEEYENQPSVQQHYSDDDISNDLDTVDYYIETEDWYEVFDWAIDNETCSDERISGKVIECYELCAEHDIPEALLNLGVLYYIGRVVEQDFKKAFEFYKKAADAGLVRAVCNCGYCFYYGRHQEIDYAKAYEYFYLGALLYNDANCLYKLGDMYLNGYYVPKNEQYAFILYKRALNLSRDNYGDNFCLADTQFRVGKCLLYGIGVKKNLEDAHEMLSYALVNFYKRRKTDIFVAGLIKSAKELLAEAEEQLDMDM